jgi:hypothetical protein
MCVWPVSPRAPAQAAALHPGAPPASTPLAVVRRVTSGATGARSARGQGAERRGGRSASSPRPRRKPSPRWVSLHMWYVTAVPTPRRFDPSPTNSGCRGGTLRHATVYHKDHMVHFEDAEVMEDGLAIVVRGFFNPAIVNPTWLHAQGMIGRQDLEASTIEVIIPQVAVFGLEWVRIEVTDDRLLVRTSAQDEFLRCRDLAAGILSTLRHTPVSAIGMNRWAHLKAPSMDAWHAIGDRIVPKDPWLDHLNLPGVASVTLQGVRPDSYGGSVRVKAEPSNLHPLSIFVEVNDHYLLVENVRQPQSREDDIELPSIEPDPEHMPLALRILSEEWDKSLSRAHALLEHVWTLQR